MCNPCSATYVTVICLGSEHMMKEIIRWSLSFPIFPFPSLRGEQRTLRDPYTVQHVRWKRPLSNDSIESSSKLIRAFLILCYFPLDLCSSTNRICAKLCCCLRSNAWPQGVVVEPKFLCPRHSGVKDTEMLEFQAEKSLLQGPSQEKRGPCPKTKTPQ